MILETKIAQTILLSLAIILAGCVVAIIMTGWDGNSSKATAQTPAQTIKATDESEITPTSSGTEDQDIQPERIVTTEPTPSPSHSEATPSTDQQTASYESEDPIADGIYIEVIPKEVYPGDEIQVNVKASFTDCGISGSEIILTFDPTVLQISELSLDGVLGSNPLVGIEERDKQKGTLRYAVARRGPSQAPASNELLASVTFKVSDTASSGLYAFTLTDAQLTDENFTEVTQFQQRRGMLIVH